MIHEKGMTSKTFKTNHICCFNDIRTDGYYCTTCGKKKQQKQIYIGQAPKEFNTHAKRITDDNQAKSKPLTEISTADKIGFSDLCAFDNWFDEYFVDTQGEDSPYRYEDVKEAFEAGAKEISRLKEDIRLLQNIIDDQKKWISTHIGDLKRKR